MKFNTLFASFSNNQEDTLMAAAAKAKQSVKDQVSTKVEELEEQQRETEALVRRQVEVDQAKAAFLEVRRDLVRAEARLEKAAALRAVAETKAQKAEDELQDVIQAWMAEAPVEEAPIEETHVEETVVETPVANPNDFSSLTPEQQALVQD